LEVALPLFEGLTEMADVTLALADIAHQLKEMNRLLAIIAQASRPLAGHRVAPRQTMIKSVALDGTIREAEVA
jgi:hypothetical protein